MRLSHFTLAVLGAIVSLTFSTSILAAEMQQGGTFSGYFNTDRWGQKVFHNGPNHIFVSNTIGKQLQRHVGEPLNLDVEKIHQASNPGGGIIQKISRISKTKRSGLALSIALKPRKIEQGKGLPLRLTVHNNSAKSITLEPRNFAFVLVTKSPFSNAEIDYKDPDGCAYWYYQSSVQSTRLKGPLLRVACRRVFLPWDPQKHSAEGQGVVLGPQASTHHDPGLYQPLHIKPDGKFATKLVIGKQLLPGEYEVFCYQSSWNTWQSVGAMSKRLPFDVVKLGPKDAKLDATTDKSRP